MAWGTIWTNWKASKSLIRCHKTWEYFHEALVTSLTTAKAMKFCFLQGYTYTHRDMTGAKRQTMAIDPLATSAEQLTTERQQRKEMMWSITRTTVTDRTRGAENSTRPDSCGCHGEVGLERVQPKWLLLLENSVLMFFLMRASDASGRAWIINTITDADATWSSVHCPFKLNLCPEVE